MKIFRKKSELSTYLNNLRQLRKTLGFVPTMGALHAGHLKLIGIAQQHCDITVCSIFVNPTQFNDPKDLEKYPRPTEHDIEKLQSVRCDVLFLPEVEEMYNENEHWHLPLGKLETILEGRYRPGHYQGVTQIVKKLFDVVNPHMAFFGQKDFQQYLIIDKMVQQLAIPVKLVMCPIVREEDGLAMSSRNVHLSAAEHQQALALSRVLQNTGRQFDKKTLPQLKEEAITALNNSEGINLEYFEICNSSNLQPAKSKRTRGLVALVAARVGNTRLIDNLILR